MKKANLYKGRKILVETGKNTDAYYRKELNIVRSIESFKNDIENDCIYDSVTLLEDNLNLYHCDIRKSDGHVELLYNIRKAWENGKYEYSAFYTKDEIEKMLKDNYFIAVEGLQEIDESDLDKLI